MEEDRKSSSSSNNNMTLSNRNIEKYKNGYSISGNVLYPDHLIKTGKMEEESDHFSNVQEFSPLYHMKHQNIKQN